MKKILNKRGSVLFLVVVIMAILVVAASATYYVLSNQHASAETHYNSEQSYQTAYSVSDTIKKYFTEYNSQISKGEKTFEGSIFEKMWDSPIPLTAAKDLTEYGLGEFDITITQDPSGHSVSADGNTETKTFEITVNAETNGETTAFTQVWTITRSEKETEYYTRFLTSTGEDATGRDVFIGAHAIYGETYFENSYTSLSNARMNKSLYCLGTLVDTETGIVFDNTDAEMIISGNYYIDTAGGSPMTLKRMLIGNDFINKEKPIQVGNAVYVYGDMYWTANQASTNSTFFVQGDCHLNSQIGTNSVIYVGGDLYIGEEMGSTWWNCGTFYVDGDVYVENVSGNIKNVFYTGALHNNSGSGLPSGFIGKSETGFQSFDIETELGNTSGGDFVDWEDILLYISNNTSKGTYQNWNAEVYFNAHYGPTSEHPAPIIDFDKDAQAATGQLLAYAPLTDINGVEVNGYIQKDNVYNDPYIAVIKDHFVWRTSSISQSLIVIDTSEITDDALYVYLDSQGSDVFSFFGGWAAGSDIVIMGDKPVIFVLPDGVSIDIGQCFIGHYDLASSFKDTGDLSLMRGYINLAAANKKDQAESIYLNSGAHNNIFLVGNGKGTVKVNGQFTFCGYFYTPRMMLDFTDNTGSLSFIGGLIVGSYIYNSTSSNLVYLPPEPIELVTDLMSKANATPGADVGDDVGQKTTVKFVAYK